MTAGALAVLALYLVYLGTASRHAYDTDVVGCAGDACRTRSRTRIQPRMPRVGEPTQTSVAFLS